MAGEVGYDFQRREVERMVRQVRGVTGGVAGGIMGAALGAASDLGIKDDFKQRVQDLIQPGTSALLVIVRKATLDKFLDALRPYGGTVLKSSLHPRRRTGADEGCLPAS